MRPESEAHKHNLKIESYQYRRTYEAQIDSYFETEFVDLQKKFGIITGNLMEKGYS